MPEFLRAPFANGPAVAPLEVLVRLVVAMALGSVVAWVYRRTRSKRDDASSFPGTLLLLTVLIAMVTQVIGDNVARAFSLVGALSIVRFRTVVQDTQDTAYVIFAVVIGMAVGANNLWVAVIGLGVVGSAAFLIKGRGAAVISSGALPLVLSVRVAPGLDVNDLLGGTMDAYLGERRLVSVATARQGLAIDVVCETELRSTSAADELVNALNRIEGVQSVELRRRDSEPE